MVFFSRICSTSQGSLVSLICKRSILVYLFSFSSVCPSGAILDLGTRSSCSGGVLWRPETDAPDAFQGLRVSLCEFFLLFALHHVIMPSCHLIFKTQLNKLHRSFDLFKSREFTWWFLFTTYKSLSILLGSYIKYSTNLEFTITHLQNIPCLCYITSWPQTLSINYFISFRSSTKILNNFGLS